MAVDQVIETGPTALTSVESVFLRSGGDHSILALHAGGRLVVKMSASPRAVASVTFPKPMTTGDVSENGSGWHLTLSDGADAVLVGVGTAIGRVG